MLSHACQFSYPLVLSSHFDSELRNSCKPRGVARVCRELLLCSILLANSIYAAAYIRYIRYAAYIQYILIGGGVPPSPPPPPRKKTWRIHCNHKKFFLSKKIFPRPYHWYPYSFRVVSWWFLVELVEIYQMTYSYMGAISLPYGRKLLVYTFD